MPQREMIRFGAVEDIAVINSQGMFQYRAHWHSEAEFVLALRDRCLYRIGEREYTLSRGDLLLIWPREVHEMISIPENGTRFIQFSASLLESNRDLAVAIRMLSPVHHLSRAVHPDLTEQLARMMQEMMDIYQSQDFFRETRCKLLVYQMLLRLAQDRTGAAEKDTQDAGFSPEAWARMRQACAYVDAHSAEDLRQTEVAAAVGVSPWYFSRLFKQYVGATFPEYLARVRVHTARRLLIDSDLTVTECAYLAGFQSTTVFNKAFSALTGCAPREYRRMCLPLYPRGGESGGGDAPEKAGP